MKFLPWTGVTIYGRKRLKVKKSRKLNGLFSAFFWILITLASLILYYSTFWSKENYLFISDKVWSDFLSHIHLIRYFSLGNITPLEYPLWVGEPMKYHFLFYLVTGLLEKCSLHITHSLNLLSTISLVILLICIYRLSIHISGSKKVAYLATILFFLNSSLSWFYPIKSFGINTNMLVRVSRNSDFYAFGPWKDTIISAFQNLNIYINQRHLPLSMSFVILISIFLFYKDKLYLKIIALIMCILLPFLNRAMVPILMICIFAITLYKVRNVKNLLWVFFSLVALVPGIYFLGKNTQMDPQIIVGYLSRVPTYHETGLPIKSLLVKWVLFWIFNLGILIPLTLHGAIIIKRNYGILSEKLSWVLIIAGLFISVNIFQISLEMAGQHKLVNFMIIIANIYAAVSIVFWYEKKEFFGKIFSAIMFLFLIMGGIVDIFPIINQYSFSVPDIPNNSTAQWILENTSNEDSFLNITYNIMPLYITGRKIYYGWPYFTSTNGYKVEQRGNYLKKVAKGLVSLEDICREMRGLKIEFIYMSGTDFMEVRVNEKFFYDNFEKVYIDEKRDISILSIKKTCSRY